MATPPQAQARSAPVTRAPSWESLVVIPKLQLEAAVQTRRPTKGDLSSRRAMSARTDASSICAQPMIVNSARTLKHLKQPASLARVFGHKGALTPRGEPLPSVLHGTAALPGAVSLGDRLLGKLSVELQALKNDPEEQGRVRARVQDARQPLTQALRKARHDLKAKDKRIRELEEQVKDASGSAAGADHAAGDQAPPPACGSLATTWLGRARQRLLAQEREDNGESSTPPRTPVGERPFDLSSTLTGTAFLIEAFAEAKAETAREEMRTHPASSAREPPSHRSHSSRALATSKARAAMGVLPSVRPGTTPRFSTRPCDRAAREAAEAKARAVSAAKAADAAAVDAAAKALLAAQAKGRVTTELSAEAAWAVTKAPREAAAAEKAASAARQEADKAALASRCADLGALEYHENENVRFFSRAPAQAIVGLATFVRDEQELTHRHEETIGKPLCLSERLCFTSDVRPVPLAVPSSALRRTSAAYLGAPSAQLVRSLA